MGTELRKVLTYCESLTEQRGQGKVTQQFQKFMCPLSQTHGH